MDLQELLLTKGEIAVLYRPSSRPGIVVPIHPILLRQDLRFDPSFVRAAFQQAATAWYEELSTFTDSLPDSDPNKEWFRSTFLEYEPRVEHQERYDILHPTSWESRFGVTNIGFVNGLSVERNQGSLFYNPDDRPQDYIAPPYVTFSPEKFRTYDANPAIKTRNGCIANVYSPHNVDHYPAALFLRNWALLILNGFLKQVEEEIKKL